MSCFSSSAVEQSNREKKSKQLDKEIRIRASAALQQITVLIVGSDSSGKNAIVRQLRGLNNSNEDHFKSIIARECISDIQQLIFQMSLHQIEYENPDNITRAEIITKLPATANSLSAEVGENITSLWADKGIQQVYELRNRFHLNDSAHYFLSDVKRLCEPDYTPTKNDIQRVRKTRGIQELEVEVEDLEVKFLDIDGQISEKRKWVHCLDCVFAVIFCASLSDYDQVLREDGDLQTRLTESLLMFDEMQNSPWFRNTPFILLLTKVDLFREKIKRVPLTVSFPDYQGEQTEDAACNFIKRKFQERDEDANGRRTAIHTTCAISPEVIRYIFGSVRHLLLDDVCSGILDS